MSPIDSCLAWNVRGLNARARHNVVREFVVQERPTLICIQETKLSNICNALATEILGTVFAYDFLPTINVSDVTKGRFSILAMLTACSSPHDS
jgi:hypothetical protein